MEIYGIRLVTVHDNAGGLLEVIMAFSVLDGSRHHAMYNFDKRDLSDPKGSAAENDARAKIVEQALQMQPMAEKVTVVGRAGVSPIDLKTTRRFSDLVPDKKKGVPADLRIGKGLKDEIARFTVELKINFRRGNKLVVTVPFNGAPGDLADRVFHGMLEYVTEGLSGSGSVADREHAMYELYPRSWGGN